MLCISAFLVVPHGIEGAQWLAAQDDPAALSELGLAKGFDAQAAAREIEAALDAGDVELAESFVALARERGVVLDPGLIGKVEAGATATATTRHSVGQFVRGFVIGEPDDLASLAGTATGDLFVFGDARDALREGVRLARGEEADELILGLACVGLAITAGTYASLGVGVPARVGMSVIKAARRAGRIGAQLGSAVMRSLRDSVDRAALKNAFTRTALISPALAVRAAREAVKVDKAGGLVHLMRDLGQVQAKAGTRGAMDALKVAEHPQDVSRLARLAESKGLKTRAIVKLLGRGAIMLTAASFNLALWLITALANLLMLCAAVKRTAERATQHVMHRRKARRQPLAATAPAG